MKVPVVDKNNKPLMTTIPSRANRWIKNGRATPFWKKGVFCIRLNTDPSGSEEQKMACGIDPGSKREAYTVATKKEVVLNVLTDTPYWVKDSKKTQKEMRGGRRFRNTPCRKPKSNKNLKKEFLAPSTKSRWQAKLRILNFLSKILPISDVIIEDIKAESRKGKRGWNKSFSPLETGKEWFYQNVEKDFHLHAVGGYDTKKQREKRGWAKTSKKLEDCWDAHNVDSHCLVEILFGREIKPEKEILRISFLQFHRRQLHALQPSKGNVRRPYGGTRSLGFKRGSLVEHKKHGLCYVGGYLGNRISLHSLETGKRLTQKAKVEDCKFKTYLSWRFYQIEEVNRVSRIVLNERIRNA